jgi:hypothetical protein
VARDCCPVICAVVLMLVSLVFAQNQPEREKNGRDKNNAENTVDCQRFGSSSGCKSFNEMVSHGDKGLLDSLANSAFICFPEDEDTFFIVEFESPDAFRPSKVNPALEESWAMASYSKYEHGNLSDVRLWTDNWKRKNKNTNSARFESTNDDSTCLISPDAIVIGFNFQNLKGAQTNYSLSIRRSTGRYLESLSSSNEKTEKGRRRIEHSEESGYCESRMVNEKNLKDKR